MARPIKEGLEYFPLDVDMDQDDKIALIEAQHGVIGFGIIIKLLMKIYKHNYYYEWTEKEQLLFSKRVNVDINKVNVIINDCIKWKLFSEAMFKTYGILTSAGIQRRYLEAIGRRQKVKIVREYLLLDNNDINVYKNLVIVDMNPSLAVVNDDINTQSKVKQSKVKESKVNNNKEEDLNSVVSYYCQRANILDVNFKPKEFQTVEELLGTIPADVIKQGIDIAFESFKPGYQGAKINSFNYCKPAILKLWENINSKKEAVKNGADSKQDKPKHKIKVNGDMPDTSSINQSEFGQI